MEIMRRYNEEWGGAAGARDGETLKNLRTERRRCNECAVR